MLSDPQDGGERPLRVLLVEDDDANREIETLMLQHLGHEVEAVADGAEALTALAASSYDAVLMDCHMPVLDGFAAAAAIRDAEAAGAHIPIIGLTAHDERRRCVEAGMDDHLAKPFALGALAAVLERAAPPPAASFAGVLDPEIVDQLRMLASAGNAELLERLQASFARDTPARLSAMRQASAEGDRHAIAFNVHTLKGSSANLGAREVVAICRQLEDEAETLTPERLERLLGELEAAAADAGAALARLARTG
jgi:CheY-like chemotaxis protein/HPt (histidine-containing phosphotransfer) domain-containing protein